MTGSKEMRFSDTELMELRREFEQHKLDYAAQMLAMRGELATNTRVTMALSTKVDNIARSTNGVVKLYRDAQGAANLGTGLQKFMLWLLKWGLIGAAIVHGIQWVLERFR